MKILFYFEYFVYLIISIVVPFCLINYKNINLKLKERNNKKMLKKEFINNDYIIIFLKNKENYQLKYFFSNDNEKDIYKNFNKKINDVFSDFISSISEYEKNDFLNLFFQSCLVLEKSKFLKLEKENKINDLIDNYFLNDFVLFDDLVELFRCEEEEKTINEIIDKNNQSTRDLIMENNEKNIKMDYLFEKIKQIKQ